MEWYGMVCNGKGIRDDIAGSRQNFAQTITFITENRTDQERIVLQYAFFIRSQLLKLDIVCICIVCNEICVLDTEPSMCCVCVCVRLYAYECVCRLTLSNVVEKVNLNSFKFEISF